jgi:hypothetical protein
MAVTEQYLPDQRRTELLPSVEAVSKAVDGEKL